MFTRDQLLRARIALRELDDAMLVALTLPTRPGLFGDHPQSDVHEWLNDLAAELKVKVVPIKQPEDAQEMAA